jgi:ribosomal protein S18 acetylase RimI-like enzyme
VTTVRLAGPDDAEEVGRVIADGFVADPVMTWVFAPPDQDLKLRAFFGFLAAEAYVPMGATWVLPGAAAVWTPPDAPPWPDDRGQRFLALLGRVCTPDDLSRLSALDAAMAASHPEPPYWYLSTVAVATEAQGAGLGTALLRQSLGPVDAAGLPAYLESTNPRNVSLYERHGFRATGRIELPDGPSMTGMWREPSTG